MSGKASMGKAVLASAGLVLLSACTGAVSVKDVTTNEKGYLASTFSPQTLPAAVAAKIPRDASHAGFGRLTIVADAKTEAADGKSESWKTATTWIDEGSGLVQKVTEDSYNDIPYRHLYSLTYKGIVDLKWQRVPLQGAVTGPIYEIKSIDRFDAAPSAVGDEFEIDYWSAPRIQIANFYSFRRLCKATRALAASELNSKLAGAALELECEVWANNAVVTRSKWVMLQRYGAAFLTELTTSARKTTYHVIDVHG